MKLLLVSATSPEILPLLKMLEIENVVPGIPSRAMYKKLQVDVLVTGVGMVATAFHLGKQLGKEKYDAAINLGLAGSFNRDLELGSVVNIVQDHFAEIGAEDGNNFLSLKEMKLEGTSEVMNGSVIRNTALEMVPQVCGISVNTVHGNEASIERVFRRFHPNTESMEGAAFLYACVNEKVPCAQLRAISNYVERRNRDAWNIPLAVKNLHEKIMEVLNTF